MSDRIQPSAGSVDPSLESTADLGAHSYCARLLQVYRQLARDKKIGGPPAWTIELFGKDLNKIRDASDLEAVPRLQAALAGLTSYTPGKWLLEREMQIRTSNLDPNVKSWVPSAQESSTQDVYDAAADEQLRGLCFSGGGIRSATFCLGIMQALAAKKELSKFDYLSTVSGGGYIHEWLASWIRNEPGRLADTVESRLAPLPQASQARAPEQITWLRRYSSYLTPRRGLLTADTWTMIAIWFRNTSLNQIVLFSFLAFCLLVARGMAYPFLGSNPARSGLLLQSSGWEWLLVAFFVWLVFACLLLAGALRSQSAKPKLLQIFGALGNLLVVLQIALPTFALCALLSLEAVHVFQPAMLWGVPVLMPCFGLYALGLLLATTLGGRSYEDIKALLHISGLKAVGITALFCLSSFVCAGIAYKIAQYEYQPSLQKSPRLYVLCEDLSTRLNSHMVHTTPTLALHQQLSKDDKPLSVLDLTLSNGDSKPLDHPVTPQAIYAAVAPVTFFALLFLAVRLQVGILGRFYSEQRREWLARLGGWSALLSIGWMALSGIGGLGPILYYWIFSEGTLKRIYGTIVLLGLHGLTLFSGASSKTAGKPQQGAFFGYSALDLVGIVGAPLCIFSLLVVVSGLIDTALGSAGQWGPALSRPFFSQYPALRECLFCIYHHLPYTLQLCFPHSAFWGLTVFAVVTLTVVFFGWRVDVNEFSLHGFYRNRLSRCYLGGTNPARTPDPFTGFDDHTEATATTGMALSDFLPAKFGGKGFLGADETTKDNTRKAEVDRKPYDGPFPIFCSTLNLTFGEDLGWQERKAASFAFTPLYTGYHVGWTAALHRRSGSTFNGYVRTETYAYPNRGIRLSTVTAVCGAALSPNQGFSTIPALAFLMTLFNVRLGWWIANTRRPAVALATSYKPTPIFGLLALLSELFGLADDTSRYVNLCDGGKFENMGMYELVRRRCKLIVVCDAEQDTGTVFEGIGGAISKCRTDFGAEITLNLQPIIPDPDNNGNSKLHFQVGTIRYPPPPGGDPNALDVNGKPKYLGRVIYIKATITGDEPGDILHHLRAYPGFPQDSTLNQWFTESQFECYRRLGQHIAQQASSYLTTDPYAVPTGSSPLDPDLGIPLPVCPVVPK